MRLAAGTRLGPYEIATPLGHGGMGEVYRATDTRLGRDVAIKILAASAADSADARSRFEREARAIASLNHPNICTLHDVGVAEGHAYLVMELLSGETLHHALERGPLPIATILDDGAALADALHAAHTRGIIHRDLKPANVFVTSQSVMKILDFGLAKGTMIENDTTHLVEAALTGPGTTLGTLSYMSPEQLKGDALDARTDLFSLGLVLYEMATGRRAFNGKTSAQVSAAILHEVPARPSTLRADLPEKLEDVILKALEKDRDLRYQNAAELRSDLKRLKRHSDAAGLVMPTTTSVAPAIATGATVSAPSGSDAALAAGLLRRHPMAIGAAAIVLIAAIAGLTFLLKHPPATPARGELTLQAITLDGHAGHATIAPDGKFIVYVRGDGVRSSVVVKQLGSNSDVVILPPTAEVFYRAPSVTPDDSFVDVLTITRKTNASALVRVPFLGGIARTVIEKASSGVGWSPDGKHMAFVRFESANLTTALVVADADGQHEHVLQTRTSPKFFVMINFNQGPPARPSWSPDGRWIAFAGADSSPERSNNTGEILEVQAETGELRPTRIVPGFITEMAYRSVDDIVASLERAGSTQWWLYPRTGEPVQLTRDLNNITDVQLTADRTTGVATRASDRTAMTVGPIAGPFVDAVPESSTDPYWGRFDALGNLYYSMRVPGEWAVFRSDAARGSGTMVASGMSDQVVTPDGQFIIAPSGGTLVRVNRDGSNRTVLLNETAEPVDVLPDGSALLYVSNRNGHQRPWLLPLSGGEPRRLSDTYIAGSELWLSRDGRQVLFHGGTDTELCSFPSFADCRVLKVVGGPLSADGRFVYAVNSNDPKNLVAQPIDGGTPTPLTHFTDRVIQDFSLSPDRTKLAITRVTRESDVVLVKGIREP